MNRLLIFLSIVLVIIPTLEAQTMDMVLNELSPEQQEQLFEKNQIIIETEIKNAPWPQISIYQIVDLPLLDFAAFYINFKLQPLYSDSMLRATELSSMLNHSIQVEYEMSLPWPLSNAKFIHSHNIDLDYRAKGIKITWQLIHSNVSEKSYGTSLFIPYKNRLIWYYQSFVKPKSNIAIIFKNKMKNDTIETLKKTISGFKNASQQIRTESTNIFKKRFGQFDLKHFK